MKPYSQCAIVSRKLDLEFASSSTAVNFSKLLFLLEMLLFHVRKFLPSTLSHIFNTCVQSSFTLFCCLFSIFSIQQLLSSLNIPSPCDLNSCVWMYRRRQSSNYPRLWPCSVLRSKSTPGISNISRTSRGKMWLNMHVWAHIPLK